MSSSKSTSKQIIIFMGVSSSGKSTVGDLLAKELDLAFLDGDAFHPKANKDKMREGIPLTDNDRWPWLTLLAEALNKGAQEQTIAISACSALKRAYRDFLREKTIFPVKFVHLHGTQEMLMKRVAERTHEYMPASLLDSQFAALEEPEADENVLFQSVEHSPEHIVASVIDELGLRSSASKT